MLFQSFFTEAAAALGMGASAQSGGGTWAPASMLGWGPGWGWGFLALVFWILVLVGIFILFRWILRTMRVSSQPGPVRKETELDILKGRYARGEIDKEEFEQKKKDLS